MSLQLSGHKLHHHLDELVKWQSGEPFFPIHLDISPIGRCNHRCVHCYVDYLGHKGPKLDGDLFRKLARDIGRCGVKSAFVAGTGEPFLNEATPEAIAIASENGTDMAVSTNGVLLDEQSLHVALPALTWMRFSILGGSRETYAKLHRTKESDWDALTANLAMAGRIKAQRTLKVTLGAVFCLMRDNAGVAVNLAKILKDSGFDYMVVKPPSQNVRNDFRADVRLFEQCRDVLDALRELSTDGFHVEIRMDQFEQVHKRDYGQCLGLPFIAMVGEDGGVYTCNGFWGNKDYCYGNLRDQDFPAIWNSEIKAAIQKRVEHHQDFTTCEPICRHNSINRFLWSLRNPPDHVNFI
ncbi:MAG: radical SAM protein [Alphaproteobacteria bacterium]|nr:radical SAM protein [Alphaproteobacteria bacterium]MBF0249275.1 radical SAM protein [Alphaproteobacteria bacterium]